MTYEPQVLREVWRITERRGGAVYRTEYVEDRWVSLHSDAAQLKGRPDGNPDLVWSNKSTSYTGPTIRSVKIG